MVDGNNRASVMAGNWTRDRKLQVQIPNHYITEKSGDFPAFTPVEASTQFSDPGGIQGWVDLGLPVQYGHQSQK